MKKSQIILFTALLVISGTLYTIVLSNKKDETKEKKGIETQKYISVKNILNQKRSLMLSSYGQILPFTELDDAFEVQGRLQKGDMILKPGTRFKKNDILWTVPNTFVASANCALLCGGKVDFVDINPITYNMDLDLLEKKLIKAKKINKLCFSK